MRMIWNCKCNYVLADRAVSETALPPARVDRLVAALLGMYW